MPVSVVAGAGHYAGGQFPFQGQAVGLGNENPSHLKKAEPPVVVVPVVGQGFQDAGGQGGAHCILFGGHRVGDAEQGRVAGVRRGAGGAQPRQIRRADQGVADGFLHPGGGQGVAQGILQGRHRVGPVVGNGGGEHRCGHFIVADDADDFLNQILLNGDVAAPVGGLRFQSVRPGAPGGDAQAAQHGFGAGDVQIHAQHLAETGHRQRNGGDGPVAGGIGVNDAGGGLSAGGLEYQLGGAAQGDGRQLRAQPLFKAQAGFGAQVQVGRRAAVVQAVKGGRFQQHTGGGRGDFAVGAAHHAADADGFVRVGDQQVVGSQDAFHAVQGGELFARRGAAHEDVTVGHGVQVKGVQRLVELQHHIVGDIHHIVDGAQAGAGQAVLQPVGRGADFDAGDDRCGVAEAQVGVGDGDPRQGVHRRAGLVIGHGRRAHGLAGDGADFPGHAEDGQAVAPVGG